MASAEEIICMQLNRWFCYQYPSLVSRFFHVPNGGHRSAVTGKLLKDMGTKRGIPDYLLMVPADEWHGMAIEVKTEKSGRVSDEQRHIIEDWRSQYAVAVCYGLDECMLAIQAYLTGTIPESDVIKCFRTISRSERKAYDKNPKG